MCEAKSMPDRTSLTPLRKTEFAVGEPTRQSIYDRHGKLLLATGVVIETQHQLNGLFDQGYVQRRNFDTPKKSSDQIASTDQNTEDANSTTPVQLDDVRWYVGETLHMQGLKDPDTRFVVKLIGFTKGKSVLVTAPFADGKYLLVRENQSFVVRVFQGKKAYAFSVTALKSVYNPYPYLHLSYPKQIVSSVIRRTARASVNMPATIEFNGQPQNKITLTDLSLGGASGIMSGKFVDKKDTGVITFKLNVVGYEELLSILVVVRAVEPTDDGTAFRYGVEFTNMPTQYKLILSAFVHQTIAEAD